MIETNLMCSVSTKGDYIALFVSKPNNFEKECSNCIILYDLLKLSLGQDYIQPIRNIYTDVIYFNSGNVVKNKITCSSWYNNDEDDVIAVGTSNGTIQFFAMCNKIYLKGINTTTEEQLNKSKINDICWCTPQLKDKNDLAPSLYACSDDGTIFECSANQAQPIFKWKASESAILSLSLVNKFTFKYLLSACLKSITVWDLNTKTKINSFIHHSTDNNITRMIHLEGGNNQFFFKASNDDRILSAWKLDDLMLKDKPINDSFEIKLIKNSNLTDAVKTAFSLTNNTTTNTNLNEFILSTAVTPKGNLFIHSKQLSDENGFKSIKSVYQVKIFNQNDKVKRLKVFSAFVLNKSTNERSNYFDQTQTVCNLILVLVYGSSLKRPIFEKIELSVLITQPKTILYRNDPYDKITATPPTWSLSEAAFISKINEQANQLMFICDGLTNEQHKNRLYYYACQSLYGLIEKISKFETLLLVWQHVLASLNQLMKKRSYKNCQEAFKIIYHIFRKINSNYDNNKEYLDSFKYEDILVSNLDLTLRCSFNPSLLNEDDAWIEDWYDVIDEGVNTIKDSIETLGNKISLDNYAILIDLLCNCFECLAKEESLQTIIFENITNCFNLIFIKETTNESNKIPQLVLASFRNIFKNYEKYEFSSAADPTITNCLDFLTFMCKHDISFVYTQRNDLFDYLDKMNDKLLTSLNDDSTEWKNLIYYAMAGLNLIENLITNWSFEIYILLDRDGINAFIDRCKRKLFEDEEEEIDDEIKIIFMANNISNQIFDYKASLRKFFVMNGYPKKLT